MSYPPFAEASETVDRFLAILDAHGIDLGGASEDEALSMSSLLDMWRNPAGLPADPRRVVRNAMGFVDLAGKVVAVENHADFNQLLPHLQMLATTSVLQNAKSPVTDATGNKVIELYIAALAMSFSQDVVLDHPDHSKGDNPDVMMTFRGRRWALALKTLHSRKPRTIFDNIKKASGQIEASSADHGLVVLNLKNELDYEAFWPSPDDALPEMTVRQNLKDQVAGITGTLKEVPTQEWLEILGPARKADVPVVCFGQAVARAVPQAGGPARFMAIKGVSTYLTPSVSDSGAMRLITWLHDASQQFH